MGRLIGLGLLVVAMSMTTGCTKNKKRAERLEEELIRCQNSLHKLKSAQAQGAEVQYASLDCREGAIQ